MAHKPIITSLLIRKTEIEIEEFLLMMKRQSMCIEDVESRLIKILAKIQIEKEKEKHDWI